MNLIFITVGRAAQLLISLAMLRAVTTMLSPEEMGKISIILTSTAFFAMFIINPVGMFINRRLHLWQDSGLAQLYLKLFVFYLIGVALLSMLIVTILTLGGIGNFGMPLVWALTLIGASLIFNTINQTTIPSLNLLGDPKSYVLLSTATLIASFLFATFLSKNVQALAQYWILGLIVGQAILGLLGYLFLIKKIRAHASSAPPLNISKQKLYSLFSFSWPVALAAGLAWIHFQGYRYLMESQLGFVQLGLFAAGYSISAGIIAGFESVLTAYFQPRLYKNASTCHPAEQAVVWQRYAVAVIPPLILTVALVVVLAPQLTKSFLGGAFHDVVIFVILGALAEAMRVIAGVYSLIAHINMQTRWLIAPNIVGAFLSISLCVVLIPPLGPLGVAIALALAGFVVVALLHLFLSNRVGGGLSLRALMPALLATIALITAAVGIRAFFNAIDTPNSLFIVILIGSSYLFLLYLILRKSLVELGNS